MMTETASKTFTNKTEPMNQPRRSIALVAAVIYLAAVALIVFWPSPVDRPASGQLHMVLDWLHQHGMPKFIGYNKVEFAANIAMFIPMGYLAATFFRRVLPGILLGALASCLIEFGQALFLPQRYATVLDVLANTTGAVLGAALYYLIRRLYPLNPSGPSKHQMKEPQP
ncbi:VanZ family protein [Specibacter sp. NPDC057265]|uniref:VanZ family protein n=1 Tax=Specibacter sp. NPDC057265 TaxID=3346075 RepID=UPI0036380D2E